MTQVPAEVPAEVPADRCQFTTNGSQCEQTDRLVLLEDPPDGWRTLCEPHAAEVMERRAERRRWPWA